MFDDVERQLREFPAHFPRPKEEATRRFERRLRARLKASRPSRRLVGFGATAVAALAAGAALGGGTVAMVAGAATERVTLTVRPTLVPSIGPATAFGAVGNGQPGEQVVIETRDCGQSAYRVFSGATTSAGGAYSVNVWFQISAVVRARWRNAVSDEVDVKRRVGVSLRRRADGRFAVTVWAQRYFERRRARIERWDRRRGRWIAARLVTLKRTIAGQDVFGSGNEVRVKVGKGVLLRAVFPTAQARPCYVGGVSRILRT